MAGRINLAAKRPTGGYLAASSTGEKIRRKIKVTLTVAFGALAHQQQVATLDGAAEIGDRCFVTAVAAPDVGQQPLADVGRD